MLSNHDQAHRKSDADGQKVPGKHDEIWRSQVHGQSGEVHDAHIAQLETACLG